MIIWTTRNLNNNARFICWRHLYAAIFWLVNSGKWSIFCGKYIDAFFENLSAFKVKIAKRRFLNFKESTNSTISLGGFGSRLFIKKLIGRVLITVWTSIFFPFEKRYFQLTCYYDKFFQ